MMHCRYELDPPRIVFLKYDNKIGADIVIASAAISEQLAREMSELDEAIVTVRETMLAIADMWMTEAEAEAYFSLGWSLPEYVEAHATKKWCRPHTKHPLNRKLQPNPNTRQPRSYRFVHRARSRC